MTKRFFICILIPVIALMTGIRAYGEDIDYGLRFRSNTYNTTTESSLLLCKGKSISTGGKDFSLEFDLRNPKNMQFGSVLRIASENCEPLDLIYYVNNDAMFIMAATYKDKVVDFKSSTSGFEDWHHVKLSISPASGTCNISFDEELQSIHDPEISRIDGFKCVFGSVVELGAGPEEVASVDIKDIQIKKEDKLLYHWALKAHGDGFCLDGIHKEQALAANCEWLADRHIRWALEMSIKRKSFLAADMGDGKLWICLKDRIESFDCISGKIDTIFVKGGYPACEADFHIRYASGKLIGYNLEDGSLSIFDPESGQWSKKQEFEGDYCHYTNSTSVDTANHRFISFGGYGLYQFSDDFSVLDYENGNFRQETIPQLSYRYRASSAIVDGQFYIHGGYGTFNGHQGFAIRYYNDLYRVDPDSFEVTKIWAEDPLDEGNIPTENMVWDEERKCFYLVRMNNDFVVEKLTLESPESKKLTLPCDKSLLNGSKYPNNIFYCKETDKLYCLSETSDDDKNSNIILLSMNWPPMDAQELIQELPSGKWKIFLIAGAVILCLTGVAVWLIRKRRKKNALRAVPMLDMVVKDEPVYDFSRSSISFFGGFKVMDKDGNDISSSFTPTLKSILVLIILSTPKGGIATSRFDRIIWPYKPEDTANNNRNVYMSRLRPLLEQIGNVRIASKSRILSIESEDGVICDYLEIMRLFGADRSNDNLMRITELLLKGQLLPNMEQTWTEPYKKELSSKTVEILGYQLRRNDLPAETTLSIADMVLKYDYLNEDALRSKCRTLASQGKTGLAKEVYDNFRSEYQDVMGIDYPLSFNKTIE